MQVADPLAQRLHQEGSLEDVVKQVPEFSLVEGHVAVGTAGYFALQREPVILKLQLH